MCSGINLFFTRMLTFLPNENYFKIFRSALKKRTSVFLCDTQISRKKTKALELSETLLKNTIKLNLSSGIKSPQIHLISSINPVTLEYFT